VASLGVVPVVMVVRADATGLRRTWYDRISGTMLVSRRSHTMYTLVLDGRSVLVDAPVLLGRAPERSPGREGVRLVSVPSDDTTVSKTHALLEPTAEGISVTDLGSTNGTYLVDSQGSHELAPGLAETVPRGGAIYFGEAECRVR
jgi:transRDD family protein